MLLAALRHPQWGIDFVCHTGGQLSQGGHFFGVDQVLLGGLQICECLGQFLSPGFYPLLQGLGILGQLAIGLFELISLSLELGFGSLAIAVTHSLRVSGCPTAAILISRLQCAFYFPLL